MRWEAFNDDELRTMNQALIDSGSRPGSSFEWYKRCAHLQAELNSYWVTMTSGRAQQQVQIQALGGLATKGEQR